MTEWKTYRLQDVTSILGDGLHGTPVYDENGDVFFINGNNLENGHINIKSNTKRVSTEEATKYRKQLNDRTILVSINGTIGNVGKYNNENCILGKSVCYFNVAEDFDYDFIYYVIANDIFKNTISRLATGTTIKNVSLETMRNYTFSAPDITTQRKISNILGAIDDKIENNRRINANLELQAQALFDELICNENLKYEYIANLEHSIETGRRPKGGVANIANGVPSIGAENIKGLGKYDYSKTKYITEEFAQSLKKGFIKGYELLIYKDGGKPGYFIPNFSIFGEGFPYDKMALNEHVFLLDFGNKGYNFFAYFFFQTEEVMRYLNAQGSKAAIPGINRNDVEGIAIPTIENKTVKEFCARVEPIIAAILTNAKESSRLATLRDTLLPKLMNGEIKTE